MDTVAEIIGESLDAFSPAERRIARTLLSDYPSAGLATTAALAKASGTSAPTVVRFTSRLGFANFGEFQAALRSELTARAKSPLDRAEEERAAPAADTDLMRGAEERARLIIETFRRIPPSQFDHAVAVLAAPNNRLLLCGGHYSAIVAQLVHLQLAKVRPCVQFLADPLGRDLPSLSDLRKRDALVVFDVRRYDEALANCAELAKLRGATVILITDQWLSPVSAHADVVLSAAVDVTFFDSLVGCLALAEAIVHEAAGRIDSSIKRLRELEGLRDRSAHSQLDGR